MLHKGEPQILTKLSMRHQVYPSETSIIPCTDEMMMIELMDDSYQILMQSVCQSEGMRQQQLQYHSHPHYPQPQQYLQSSQQYPVGQSYPPPQQQAQQPSILTLQQQQQSLQHLGMLTFPADVHPVSAGVASGTGRTVHLRVTPSGLAPLSSISNRDLTTSAAHLDPNVILASLWICSQQCLEHLPCL